jgi:hypothetical protein
MKTIPQQTLHYCQPLLLTPSPMLLAEIKRNDASERSHARIVTLARQQQMTALKSAILGEAIGVAPDICYSTK